MHKNATKCDKTLSKWCKNKPGASKIIDTFETYLLDLDSNFVDLLERSCYEFRRTFLQDVWFLFNFSQELYMDLAKTSLSRNLFTAIYVIYKQRQRTFLFLPSTKKSCLKCTDLYININRSTQITLQNFLQNAACDQKPRGPPNKNPKNGQVLFCKTISSILMHLTDFNS
jgi:hypothetical protein